MMNPKTNLRDVLYGEVMMAVEKPSRYVGTEYNTHHKDPAEVDLRVALVFPDLYDLGLGNLGLLILYAILNRLPWCWAERAYAPAPDMEAALRERGLPAFLNESKDGLACADLIGFTLQSELTYTNVLNLIDLAGLPLRASDREDGHPLVMAGGPTVFNPEPLAPFIDFFVIGDGEEAVVDVVERLRAVKHEGRQAKLEALAELDGVYVPALYPTETLPDGRIVPEEGAQRIVRRVVDRLDDAPFPTDYIVPFTQQVHDRVGLEVHRGCTQGCRFCQAGMTTRPVRERSLGVLDALMTDALDQTGYAEVSLLSLSTCDYSRAKELVRQSAARAGESRASVALPSLRLDSFSVELADSVAGARRTGLTVAPEAASPRLRAAINKWIPDEQLLGMAREAYLRGWGHVKTYFMIGLPTERDEDVEAIVDLCVRTLQTGRDVTPRAKVNTGVSTFVPKPWTPFQWAPQISIEEAIRRQGILAEGFKHYPGVKFGRHDPRATFVEGLISRGDRRTGDLIEAAWHRGARFESWDEKLDWEAWQGAIEDTGFDVDDALRQRDLDERLPWDHIDPLVSKDWLKEEWRRAMALEYAQDCRQGACNFCGVSDHKPALCSQMRQRSAEGRELTEAERVQAAAASAEEPASVQRLRFRIGRAGEARFLSHLELVNTWIRVLRRAKTPMAYSQGFHAHPKLTFATAPPVGEESRGDLMDVVLIERVEPEDLLARVQSVLPMGFGAYGVCEVPLRGQALMAATAGFAYTFRGACDVQALERNVERLTEATELLVERRVKPKGRKRGRQAGRPGTKRINVRPMIESIRVAEQGSEEAAVDVETRFVENRGVKPRELLELIGFDPARTRVVKRETRLASGEPVPPAPEDGVNSDPG
ncbi:MAG: TIGR03960 family B12-binding radical SAM protein [bacterium]|nr:TIGR03960 family B12-binding radical SAM protein [bacterium]